MYASKVLKLLKDFNCVFVLSQLLPFMSYNKLKSYHFMLLILVLVRRNGVVGRVSAFHPRGKVSITGAVRNVNFYPGTGCVSFVFCPVLSLTVALTFC